MKSFEDELARKAESASGEFADLKDRVADVTSKAKDKAGEMADSVAEKWSHQRQSAAEGLGRAASAIRDKAESIPGGPKVAGVTQSIADGIDSTASYLRDHDVNQMGRDVVNLCRRYPTQSLVAAIAVGFLIGRSRR
jgi:hypothetical protein